MGELEHEARAKGQVESTALLDAARAGDPRAQGELLRKHARLVEWALRRIVGGTPDLEDLVQEVFLAALQGLPRYRGDARFESWLRGIAVHVACHWLRAPRRRHPVVALAPDDGARPARASEEAEAREAFARVHLLLDRLTPKKRVAFLLHVALGHSTREIAALMGSTHAAAKARIWFARREIEALAREDAVLAAWMEEGA